MFSGRGQGEGSSSPAKLSVSSTRLRITLAVSRTKWPLNRLPMPDFSTHLFSLCPTLIEATMHLVAMHKTRLEAFSDGVIAILITIMVLELKIPREAPRLSDLHPLWPAFLSYILSFIYLGIYWNNHHHMLHAVQRVSGGILWANLHLLFWLSLIPFATGWLGENHFAAAPAALYGLVLLMAACAYSILQRAIIRAPGGNPLLCAAIGRDLKI